MRILYMTANPQYALENKPDPDTADASHDVEKSSNGRQARRPSVRKYAKLDLWPELRNVADVLFEARAEGFVELEVVPEVRRRDVVRYIAARRPNIVHFSGHGEKGEIVLSDDRAGEMVSTDWLKGALAERKIDVLVLNCCWSATLAEELKDEVDLIVGTKIPIGSKSAADFSRTFYDELQSGATLGAAYEAATKQYDGGLYMKEHKDESVLDRTLVPEPGSARSALPDAPAELSPAQEILNYKTSLDHVRDRLWLNVFWDVSMIIIAFEIAFISFGVLKGAYAEWFAWLAEATPRNTPIAYLFHEMASMDKFIEKHASWFQWEPFAVFAVMVGEPGGRLASYVWLALGSTIAGRVLDVVGLRPEPSIRKELATGRIQTMFKRLAEQEQ